MDAKNLQLPWRAEHGHSTEPCVCYINHKDGHERGSVAVMYDAEPGTAGEAQARHLVKAANSFDLLHAFAMSIRELSTNAPGRDWAGKMADEVLASVEEA